MAVSQLALVDSLKHFFSRSTNVCIVLEALTLACYKH